MRRPILINAQPATIGWGFWGRWLAATALAWIAGFLAAIILSHLVVNLVYPKETNLIVGLCLGATVGLFQVVAVRRWIALSGGWVWGAVVALAPPFVAAVLLDEFGPGAGGLPWLLGLVALTGGVIGSWLQARALRPYTSRALWWVLAGLASWGLAWLSGTVAGPLPGGIVLGAASGGLLLWLLRDNTASAAA